MNKAKIFLIDEKGKDVKEMLETPYPTEEVLQHLLVLKPGLLPGDQIDPENPREWFLVKREMGVPADPVADFNEGTQGFSSHGTTLFVKEPKRYCLPFVF